MTIRGTNGYFGYTKYLAYLRTLPPDTIVGEAADPHSCPIAREIKRLVPETKHVSVAGSRITYGHPVQRYPLNDYDHHEHRMPDWVSDFVAKIDAGAYREASEEQYGRKYWPSRPPISAAEAIKCMEAIKP